MCDRCGKLYKNKEVVNKWQGKGISAYRIEFFPNYFGDVRNRYFDFCNECQKDLMKWFNMVR